VATVTPIVHTNVCIELEQICSMWVIHIGPTLNLYELLSTSQKSRPKYIYCSFNFCVCNILYIYFVRNKWTSNPMRIRNFKERVWRMQCSYLTFIFVSIGCNLCMKIMTELPHRLITIYHLCLLGDLNENCNERVQGYLKWYVVVTQCLSKLNMMFRWLEFPSLPAPM